MIRAGCRAASIALGLMLTAGGCGSRVVIYGAAGAGSSDGMSAHGGAGSDDSSPGSPIARGGALSVGGSSAGVGGVRSTASGGFGIGGSAATGGSTATGGVGRGGSSGSSGIGGNGHIEGEFGVRLNPVDGWIDGTSNDLMIQGAVFAFGDTTSKIGMTSSFDGNACIAGTAAKVDLTCDLVPPATDCFGTYFGAAIGLNLNQPLDITLEPPAGGEARPFDASALKGFYFELSGDVVPPPSAFRFKVDDGSTEFCNPSSIKIKAGANTVLFSDLVSECWTANTDRNKPVGTSQSKLIKLTWQVVTNTASTTPFDFCVSNIMALRK